MENSDFLMDDEEILYSAKWNKYKYLIFMIIVGGFPLCLIDDFFDEESFDIIYSSSLLLVLYAVLLLLLLLVVKILMSSWLKHKNSSLYITSRGIHWPCDKGYDFIAWNEVFNYEVGYVDEYGYISTDEHGGFLVIRIRKNNGEKIEINLSDYQLCNSNAVDAAIKKALAIHKIE